MCRACHTAAMSTHDARTDQIVGSIKDAFAPMMEADPKAFRTKYRKMAADPHAFYRGSACLYYADVTAQDDDWVNKQSGAIWIHGDLHAENFGTYLSSDGRLVFDVNDFDEAYIGHFTWDLQRFAASLALLGWQKALPVEAIESLITRYVEAYLAQVDLYAGNEDGGDFALNLDNTDGPVLDALMRARRVRRADLLDAMTFVDAGVRMFSHGRSVRKLPRRERVAVEKAFHAYLDTIPKSKRFDRDLFYELRDVVGKSGFGIGSAGLPAYSLLVEGYSQALDNDVVLSMKQANVPALSRFVDSAAVDRYFDHEGHRTVVSQRALQVHTDPLLGYCELAGTGFVVAEVSPYGVDLDWENITEPDDMALVVHLLGRATAKIHCASDADSDQDLVDFQVEDAIVASVKGRRREFTEHVVAWSIDYAETVRADHALFVEAFRSGKVGVAAT